MKMTELLSLKLYPFTLIHSFCATLCFQSQRLQSDLLISVVIMILAFAIHVSTVFIQPLIGDIVFFTVAAFGFIVHYVIPQLRKEMPWLCCSHPLLKSKERSMFETTSMFLLIYSRTSRLEHLWNDENMFETGVV